MAIGRAQPNWSLAVARAEEGAGQGKGQGRSGTADGASMAWTATAGPASRGARERSAETSAAASSH